MQSSENYTIPFPGKISGSGWSGDLKRIILTKIAPQSVTENIIKPGWSTSIAEINFEKDKLKAKLVFDEFEGISLELIESNDAIAKQRLHEWAGIIIEEAEKLI